MKMKYMRHYLIVLFIISLFVIKAGLVRAQQATDSAGLVPNVTVVILPSENTFDTWRIKLLIQIKAILRNVVEAVDSVFTSG